MSPHPGYGLDPESDYFQDLNMDCSPNELNVDHPDPELDDHLTKPGHHDNLSRDQPDYSDLDPDLLAEMEMLTADIDNYLFRVIKPAHAH